MLCEPFRGIVLAAHEAGLRRQIVQRVLLGAGRWSRLEAKDEDESCHWDSFNTMANE
jgi:hypothetical protein